MQAEEGATPVALRCFPPSDAAFRQHAEDAAGAIPARRLLSPEGPRTLERALRETYPQSVVRARSDLAALDLRPAPTWYVYRDGKVIADDPESAGDERS